MSPITLSITRRARRAAATLMALAALGTGQAHAQLSSADRLALEKLKEAQDIRVARRSANSTITLHSVEEKFRLADQTAQEGCTPKVRGEILDAYIDFLLNTKTAQDNIAIADSMLRHRNENPLDFARLQYMLGCAYSADGKTDYSVRSFAKGLDALRGDDGANDSTLMARLLTGWASALRVSDPGKISRGDLLRADSIINEAMPYAAFATSLKRDAMLEKAYIYANRKMYEAAFETLDSAYYIAASINTQALVDAHNTINPLFTQKMRDKDEEYERQKGEILAQYDKERKQNSAALTMTIVVGFVAVFAIVCLVLTLVRYRITNIRLIRAESHYRDNADVLSILAHDSTNLFNTLLGFSNMLLEKSKSRGDSDDEECARQVHESASRLYKMVSNAMAWGQTQSQLKPQKREVLLSDCVNKVISVAELMATEKNIAVVNNVESNTVVAVDPAHLEIMLRNIISNAIKFSNIGGTITVGAIRARGKVDIMIEDKGVGMDMERVSDFNQEKSLESTEGTKNEHGTGFGLSICRTLANNNDGSIAIASTAGEGTVVTIRLNAKL